MSLLALSGTNSVSGGYEIGNSLKLEDDNEEGMAKNFTGDGDRRTWTYSTWVKRTEITGSDSFHLFGASYSNIQFMTNDLLRVELYDGSNTRYADLNRVFRDTSAWYHIVVALDSTQSTAADRVKIYINGVQDTSFNNNTYTNMSQNDQFDFGSASANYQFGYYFAGGSNDRRFCGYVAETHYVNGTALDETSFGEFDNNGIWIPKEYTGSHGSKGFYFKFDDSSNLGKDSASSGIGDFTLTNISAADQAVDTPTNNFCVINAINLSTQTLTQGATKIVSTDNTSRTSFGTMAVSKGKWWWEGKIQVYESNTTYPCIGVTGDLDNPPATSAQLWKGNHVVVLAKAQKWVTNDTGYSYGTAYADNDIINIALDMDNHIMYTYKNGTIDDASGINFSSQSAATADDFYIPINLVYVTGGGSSWEMNFGGFANYTISSGASDANGYGTFEYAPPSGYYALCTKNLAEYG